MTATLIPLEKIDSEKADFSSTYNISYFLLEGLEGLEDRELSDWALEDREPKEEIEYGRRLARERINHLKFDKSVSKQTLQRAISILYRDKPDKISGGDGVFSIRGYLSRLEEEFH